MSAITVTTIKNAIRAWVITGSGYAEDHVVWTLGARAPGDSYIHLRIRWSTVGTDWVDQTVNPTPTAGNDAIATVRGGRYGWLTITCFSREDFNSGARSPESVINDVLTAVSLPSINDALNAAKVGLLTFGPIEPVDLVIDSVAFEPRAYVLIKFHTVASLSETGPAIDTVGISGDITTGNAVQTVTFDA